MSRRFYILAKAKPNTTIEQCERLVVQLEKHGIDFDGPDCHFMFNGDITIGGLLFEQCKAIIRILWNCVIPITEVGEDIEDCSFVIFIQDEKKPMGMSEMYDRMDEWAEEDADVIYDTYMSEYEDEEDEAEEDEEDEEIAV